MLLTDFGLKDPYAGILKGVIASISPETQIIDLSHAISAQDILQGSFLLAASFFYFPKGSIFCVVVDPGVGSERKCICIETKDYYFIGPDNGVLWKAASLNGVRRMIHLTHTGYFLDPVSRTFQGRDIFAPVAAHISKGIDDISVLGEPLENCIELEFPEVKESKDSLELCVIHIDWFGNLILNLQHTEFIRFTQNREFCLTINGRKINRLFRNYAEAGEKELFLMVSSYSYMEISIKNSNAAESIQANRLDKALLKRFNPT